MSITPDQLMDKIQNDIKADLDKLGKLAPSEMAEFKAAATQRFKALEDILDSCATYLKSGDGPLVVREAVCARGLHVLPITDLADLVVIACGRLANEERGFAQ